jgi:hypothetical protein
MRSINYHFGIGYEVWKGPDSWLWLVVSPYRDAGIIGVAASQDQAARDVRQSIEEMTTWPYLLAATSSWTGKSALQGCEARTRAKIQWEAVLSQLQRYLSQVTDPLPGS